MLLFQKRFHEGLVSGAVRLTVRRWDKPRVKPGGRYRVHPIGVVEVDALAQVPLDSLTAADARAAGFAELDELLSYLAEAPTSNGPLGPKSLLYKVTLHHGGDGDRVQGALETDLTAADVEDLRTRLARLDKARKWTRKVLELIRANPRIAASKLALKLKLETEPFKIDVRKLKRLGLTQSFEVGYELSPRGVKFLELEAPPRRSAQKRKS